MSSAESKTKIETTWSGDKEYTLDVIFVNFLIYNCTSIDTSIQMLPIIQSDSSSQVANNCERAIGKKRRKKMAKGQLILVLMMV
jgi:hypothetical protein